MLQDKEYQTRKDAALKIYRKIIAVACPALGGVLIKFNFVGFHHLIRKFHIRSHEEQVERFGLIPLAPIIISNPKVHVTYRKTGITQYWGLESSILNQRVRVVIRQIAGKNKHFYSIMKVETKNPLSEIL